MFEVILTSPSGAYGLRKIDTILDVTKSDRLSGKGYDRTMIQDSALAARSTRTDARANRERILCAAAQAFAEDGVGVSMIEIARRAGVGNATLHRNFTKEQLIEELFEEWFARRLAVAEQAMADPDAWHGLVSFLEDILVDGPRNRGITALFAVHPNWRERASALTTALLLRAQEAGAARSDLTSQMMTITCQSSTEQWRRHLAIVLDGMKAEHRERLPGLPMTEEQLTEQLVQWSQQILRAGSS